MTASSGETARATAAGLEAEARAADELAAALRTGNATWRDLDPHGGRQDTAIDQADRERLEAWNSLIAAGCAVWPLDPGQRADHQTHPDYSKEQVLHPGCPECASQGIAVWPAISHLDAEQFTAAWKRAAAYTFGELTDISDAEVPVLRALWALQVQLTRLGVPVGTLPGKSA